MIKNLIFDFGKVLVDYDFDAFFHKYIPDANKCQEFALILNNTNVQQRIDKEEQPFDEIIKDIISQNKEFEIEINIFHNRYPEIVTGEVEGMRELLSQLKQDGYRLYGLSNWCSKVHQTIAQYEIFNLLEGYIISSEEKVIKPDAEIYHRLFNKFNLKPEECIFADDKYENIEGARRVGMDGILFTDAKQYEKELKKRLKNS